MFAAREPSAVDRLAALVDPDGAAAENIKLWDEHQEEMRWSISFMGGFGGDE